MEELRQPGAALVPGAGTGVPGFLQQLAGGLQGVLRLRHGGLPGPGLRLGRGLDGAAEPLSRLRLHHDGFFPGAHPAAVIMMVRRRGQKLLQQSLRPSPALQGAEGPVFLAVSTRHEVLSKSESHSNKVFYHNSRRVTTFPGYAVRIPA